MLVDTTFIIDIMQDDRDAIEKAKELNDSSTAIVVGTPTIFELYLGVGLTVKSSEEREKILDMLKSLTQLPLDTPSAERAGRIHAERVEEGLKVDPEDAMLAGIAIENHQSLLTRNRKDFSGIPQLKVEGY